LTEDDDQALMLEKDRALGKYPISVASNLTEVPVHKLRAFERMELIDPGRTEGGTRLYSDEELGTIRRIAELTGKGVNYAGVREIFKMTEGEITPSRKRNR